jgi:hypothetical protein
LKFAGTKFKKFGKTWEIYYSDKTLKEYKCVCKDNPVYEFRDFKVKDLEGVEFN